VNESLSAEDVATFEELSGQPAEDSTCRAVCEFVVSSGETVTVDGCEVQWSTGGGAAAEDKTGTIECFGTITSVRLCEGRRPLGHLEIDARGAAELPRVLACMAHLEAAAVDAFEELAVQLGHLRAPGELVNRCLAAADDERLHARLLSELAERGGAHVTEPKVEWASDGLYDIALHNAVEGCVNETWAALVAHWRARHAPDADLRRIFLRIAEDETRHGQLAWDLHTWFCSQLDDAQRDAVHAAQIRALAALPDLARRQSNSPAELGQPTAKEAAAMAVAFGQRLAA